MKSTGQTLKESRLLKKIDISEAARITRIRPEALIYIEADDYTKLPNATVTKGFIKNYGQFLGLNTGYLLAIFRRDFAENIQGQIVPRGLVEPVTKSSLWTPKATIIASVVLLFTSFAGYLGYQYFQLLGPPVLALEIPAQDISTTEYTVEIKGRTDPEATISVNDQLVVLDKGGYFSLRLPLNVGTNSILVTATSKGGKTSTLTRLVTLTPAP